jgi:hypothetical protein
MKTSNKKLTLDWNHLVGFNQVRTQGKQGVKRAKAVLAAKIGGKPAGAE